MGKGSAPEPPDPQVTAGAQTANNIGTAVAQQQLNSINQITPTGSLQYFITGANGELISPADYSAGGFNGAQATTPPAPANTPAAPTLESGATDRLGPSGANPYAVADTASTEATQGGTSGPGFQYTDPNTGQVYTIPQMTAVTTLSDSEQGIFDANQVARQNLARLGADQSARIGGILGTEMDFGSLPQGGSAANLNTPNYQGVNGLQGLNTSLGAANISSGIGYSGEILRDFADAGDITRTYGAADGYSADRQRVEDALMSRLNPSLERDREALRTSLVNQGIREGSEAFDRAMNRFGERSNDARMQAILAGGQEQSRLDDLAARRAGFENAAQQQQYNQLLGRAQFSNAGQQQLHGQKRDSAQLSLQAQIANAQQELARFNAQNQAIAGNNAMLFQAANFDNNLADRGFANDLTLQGRMDADRATALNEMFAARNQPINEIGALLGTGQVQMPSFMNTQAPQLANVDRAGLEQANFNAQMQQYNANQRFLGGLLGTGGNIGASLISDRRLKRDIEQIGTEGSLNVYRFRYLDSDEVHTGFMADEVQEIAPEAVVWKDGFAMVDYDMARAAA